MGLGCDGLGFAEFAAAETPRLFGLARVLCGNDHDAWDLTQEALTRVSARWDRLAHHDNMAAYARKTLANLHKSSHRRRREVLVAHLPEPGVAEEPGQQGLDAWLDAAMRALPRRQRIAVTLTYLEDRPIDEVAEILGCGVATAKTHIWPVGATPCVGPRRPPGPPSQRIGECRHGHRRVHCHHDEASSGVGRSPAAGHPRPHPAASLVRATRGRDRRGRCHRRGRRRDQFPALGSRSHRSGTIDELTVDGWGVSSRLLATDPPFVGASWLHSADPAHALRSRRPR
ncbi:MAG: SigE family RNA polymerase sigma factor [Nocardioides sp.]|uniref:SigE family RNA polymerase sigma factor n=1 Tax=Nocardioides sp. TaxID=35761 RepID=UPI0039E5638A